MRPIEPIDPIGRTLSVYKYTFAAAAAAAAHMHCSPCITNVLTKSAFWDVCVRLSTGLSIFSVGPFEIWVYLWAACVRLFIHSFYRNYAE